MPALRASTRWTPSPTRPLDGLRVLDLTRVLAGPTCGRTLAAFGADVLHVRGPNVPVVPAFVVDTGHGKRQAHADFADPGLLAALRRVALGADVVVQGYRPGVVARYGLDEDSLRADGFGGVYGSVSAFGHDGPWADRAGWEQLAQSTSGLCLDPLGDEKPAMLPCAFTDYTTGFVMAAGIMEALDAVVRRRPVEASRRLALSDRRVDPACGPPRRGRRRQPGSRRSCCVPSRVSGWSTISVRASRSTGSTWGGQRPTTPLGEGTLSW